MHSITPASCNIEESFDQIEARGLLKLDNRLEGRTVEQKLHSCIDILTNEAGVDYLLKFFMYRSNRQAKSNNSVPSFTKCGTK